MVTVAPFFDSRCSDNDRQVNHTAHIIYQAINFILQKTKLNLIEHV